MTSIDSVARRAAPWVERLGRFGYASKGVVFLLVGVLAATAALHGRERGTDQSDAFGFILRQPAGRWMLAVIGAGLIGYAIWKVGSGIGDWDRVGRDHKGIATRIFMTAVGLSYAAMAAGVLRVAFSRASGMAGSDAKTQHWTSRILDLPFGAWLAGIAGAAVVAYGIQQLTAAWNAKLSEQLRLGELSPAARRRVVGFSRFGIGARGVVFAIIGASLISAAMTHSATRAHGTAGALGALGSSPFGHALLAIIAAGVASYGLYAFLNARYRVFRAE